MFTFKKSDSPNASFYTCFICGVRDLPSNLMSTHIQTNHLYEHNDYVKKGEWEKDSNNNASNQTSSFECPVCNFKTTSLSLLQKHVNEHFDDVHVSNSSFFEVNNNESYSLPAFEANTSNNFDKAKTNENHGIPVLWRDDMKSCLESVNDLLKIQLEKIISKNNYFSKLKNNSKNKKSKSSINLSEKFSLLNSQTTLVNQRNSSTSSSSWILNKGTSPSQSCSSFYIISENFNFYSTNQMPDESFGCGYRNLQLILSSFFIYPSFVRLVFQDQPFVPSILRLQMLLEEAWQAKFDEKGKIFFGGKIQNKTNWIGTTELFTILSYLNVRCTIYDFATPFPISSSSSSSSKHPKLYSTVKNYFVSSPYKIPVFLQHQGHSRSIVGIFEKEEKYFIIMDPMHSKWKLQKILDSKITNFDKNSFLFLVNEKKMKSNQYQLLTVDGLMTEEERERCKIVSSIKMS